jgi:hypothetical protein
MVPLLQLMNLAIPVQVLIPAPAAATGSHLAARVYCQN